MDSSAIEIPTRISFTDSQKERNILNKFEIGENVNIKRNNQLRKAAIAKCPDLHTENYTVIFLDNDNHIDQVSVPEDQIEPLPISVRAYTLLVLFSSMDFISDIIYALFSQFNDENLRKVAILLLFVQFIMFIILDTRKFSQILILVLYWKDVKERFAKYLECEQYYEITSCFSREYYMHWLPLWDTLRIMFNFEDLSNYRPQYFLIKENNAVLITSTIDISNGNEERIIESTKNIGQLKKDYYYKFQSVIDDTLNVSPSSLKAMSSIYHDVYILKSETTALESRLGREAMKASMEHWKSVAYKDILLPLINIILYTRDCLFAVDNWYTCREPSEFENKVKDLVSKTYGVSMLFLPLFEESTCIMYYYVYSFILNGFLIVFSIFPLVLLALVDPIYFIQKHFRNCTKTDLEIRDKKLTDKYLGGSITEQSGDTCTVSWGNDKKLSFTCAFSELEPSTDANMYFYKFPNTIIETAIALTKVKEKRSYMNLRLRYIKNDVVSYLFVGRYTFNMMACHNATLFSYYILEHLLIGLFVILYPIFILGSIIWSTINAIFVHPILFVFLTMLNISIYLLTTLLFMLWTVQRMLLLALYVIIGLIVFPIGLVVSILLFILKLVWDIVFSVVSGVLVAFLLYVACTLKLFGYPVVGSTFLSSEIPEQSMEALVQQIKNIPVVLRDDSFPSSNRNLFETVKHHDTLESFNRAFLAEMLLETIPQLAIACINQASIWRAGSYTTSGLVIFLFQAITSCYIIMSELFPYSYYVFGLFGGRNKFGSDIREFPQYYSKGGRPKLIEYQKRINNIDHRHLGDLKILNWENPYLNLFFYSSLFLLLLSFLLFVIFVFAVSVGHISLQASIVFGVVTYILFAVSIVLLDASLFRKINSCEVFISKFMLVSIPILICFIISIILTALIADGTLKSLSFSWASAIVIIPLITGVTFLVRSLLRSNQNLIALWSLLMLGLLALLLLVVSINWDYQEQGVELRALYVAVGSILGPGSLLILATAIKEDRDFDYVIFGLAFHYFSVPIGIALIVAGAIDFHASSITLLVFSVVKTFLNCILALGLDGKLKNNNPLISFLLPDFYVMISCALLIKGEKSVILCSIPIIVSSAILCSISIAVGNEMIHTTRSNMRESGLIAMSTLMKEFPLVVAALLAESI